MELHNRMFIFVLFVAFLFHIGMRALFVGLFFLAFTLSAFVGPFMFLIAHIPRYLFLVCVCVSSLVSHSF